MAIWIKIQKILEKNGVGYYKIYKENYKETEFYMGIDKSARLIKFYITEDFSKPVHIIDYNKNEPIGCISGVSMMVFSRAFIQAVKVLDMETFPDVLDYAA
jgi:hypothetical protein